MAYGPLGLLEFTGLRELEPLEQTIVKGISQEYFPIIQREVHNDIDVLVHVKAYNKGGKRSKYSVHLKLIYAGNVLDVNKVHDWDLPRGVHESFVALLNMAKHKFRGDVTNVKARKSINKNEKGIKRREMLIRKDKKKSKIRKQTRRKRNRTY
jgi:hypothetical protein